MVIPVKGMGPKSRLATLLTPGRRETLSELMLQDVLSAFAGAGLESSCIVVSSSERVLELARRSGATGVAQVPDQGVNAAVASGALRAESDHIMVVPADLPLLRPADVREAVSLVSALDALLLAPSFGFDGTNLLGYRRSSPVQLSFDRDSFWNHLRSGAGMQMKVAVFSARGFRFDVDSVSHLRTLARSGSPGRAAAFARTVVGP